MFLYTLFILRSKMKDNESEVKSLLQSVTDTLQFCFDFFLHT